MRPQQLITTIAKRISCFIAIVCVAPFGICELAMRRLMGRDVFFEFQGELFTDGLRHAELEPAVGPLAFGEERR